MYGARAGAGRRLLHPVEQLFENRGVVAFLVLRREQQGETFLPARQLVKHAEFEVGFGAPELLKIFLAKAMPMSWLGMKPLAQFVGRRQFAQPLIDCGPRLAETSRPKTVHQHTRSIRARRRFVDP